MWLKSTFGEMNAGEVEWYEMIQNEMNVGLKCKWTFGTVSHHHKRIKLWRIREK